MSKNNTTIHIPEPEQQLYNWYFNRTMLDCSGSATVIKEINVITREVLLPFRDGSAVLSFEEALQQLKPATKETRVGNER